MGANRLASEHCHKRGHAFCRAEGEAVACLLCLLNHQGMNMNVFG